MQPLWNIVTCIYCLHRVPLSDLLASAAVNFFEDKTIIYRQGCRAVKTYRQIVKL